MLNIQYLLTYFEFLTIKVLFVVLLAYKILLIKIIDYLYYKIDVKHLINWQRERKIFFVRNKLLTRNYFEEEKMELKKAQFNWNTNWLSIKYELKTKIPTYWVGIFVLKRM